MTNIDPNVIIGILGAASGIVGTIAGVMLTTRISKRQDAEREYRDALNDVAKARFYLVTELMHLAHAGPNRHEEVLEDVREKHSELLLAVEVQCRLQEKDCLRSAARMFKTRVIRPAAAGNLSGGALAKATRETADEFNAALANCN